MNEYPSLMIPGPVDVCDRVLSEMRKPVVAHYGEEWAQYYSETAELMKRVLGTRAEVVIYNGSGTAALDALICSSIEEGDKVLIGCNGWFGCKIERIVKSYRGDVIMCSAEWGDIITPALVETTLEKNDNVKLVIMVHNETSTGVRNPIHEIGRIVKEYGCLYMVDAVSSIGGMEFYMDEWGVDLLATASQKAIGAPPGLGIMAVNEKAFGMMDHRAKPPSSFYLDLVNIKRCIDTNKHYQPYEISLAIHNVRALRVSLEMILEEGLGNRIVRHCNMARLLREGLRSMNLSIMSKDEEHASDTITVCSMPEGINQLELLLFLKERHNIIIAPGLGDFKKNTVRIGHMNLGATPGAIYGVLNGLERFLGSVSKNCM